MRAPSVIVIAALGLSLLQGCAVVGVGVVYDASRQTSTKIIGAYLAEQQPGIDQEAGASCIIKAMKTREVIALGTSDSTFITPTYRRKVDEVMLRPGVADCLAAVPVRG